MGACIVQIPATQFQEYRFLRQETVCMPLQNIQMLYKSTHLFNPPAQIAAIRPFLLSWSFKISFTAGDCMKRSFHKSLFGVDYLKHGWIFFHCKFLNKFYKENQLTAPHPASQQRPMKTLRRRKTETRKYSSHKAWARKPEGTARKYLAHDKASLIHSYRKSLLKIFARQIRKIHEIPPVSSVLKKIYMGHLTHIPGLTNCVIPSKSYLIDQLVCPPAFHKVFILPLQQFSTRDRILEQSPVGSAWFIFRGITSSFATVSSSYD